MADGYGTGMSARPLDFASGGLAFFNSAIQARKQEIQSHMVEATKNQELMLKAMDMKGLGEVAGKARDRMDNEINTFRSELVDRYKRSQGKLTSGDRTWMEGKSIDIQNNIDLAKNQLAALEKAKLMITPDKWNSYDDHVQLMKDIATDEERIGKGDKYVNPLNTVMKHFRQPTPEEILAKRITDLKVKFDTAPVKKDNGDGTYTVTNKLTPAGLEAIKTAIGNDPVITKVFTGVDKNGQPYVDESRIDTTIENMYGESGTIRYKPKATGAGATSASAVDLQPTELSLIGNTYPGAYKLNTPVTVTNVINGVDLATKKSISGGAGKFEVAWVVPEQNKMILVGRESGNKNLVLTPGGEVQYALDKTGDKVITEKEILKDPVQLFKRRVDNEDVKDVTAKKNADGSITITGKSMKKATGWFSKDKYVDEDPITINPVKDTTAPQYIEVPLDPTVLSKSFKKTKLSGVPMEQALSHKTAPTQKASTSGTWSLPGLKK